MELLLLAAGGIAVYALFAKYRTQIRDFFDIEDHFATWRAKRRVERLLTDPEYNRAGFDLAALNADKPATDEPSFEQFVAALALTPQLEQSHSLRNVLTQLFNTFMASTYHKLDPTNPTNTYNRLVTHWKTLLAEFNDKLTSSSDNALFITQQAPDPVQFQQLLNTLDPRLQRHGRLDPNEFTITQSLAISDHSWFEGVHVVAPSGRGKTTLLKYLVSKVPEPDACIIIMDAKGELLQSFNQLAQWKDRYVYLQPSAEFPLAINPLEIGHSIEFLEYIFSALLESKMTPNQSTLFRMVLTLCKVIPNANLETFRLILSRGPKEFEHYVRKLKPRDQDFFDMEWKERIYAERRPEVLARLRTLMTHDALDAILQAPHTKIDFGSLMDEAKVICINNNYEELGEQGCEFFSRLFISLVWAAARKRSQRTNYKNPVYFFIDEAHYAIARDPKIATILHQCRAQKISMIFAHQQMQQIKDDDVKHALNDCAIKFVNSSGEAHELAPRLETTPEFLKTQKRGQFALYVRDTTPTAVSVSITPVHMDQYPMLSRDEVMETLKATIERYCYQYTTQTYSDTQEQPTQDDNLYWKVTLSPRIAAKGGSKEVSVRADDGSQKVIRITIKAGTQHGDRCRIKGYGGLKKDSTRGDIIIEWIIPQRADKAEQKAKEKQTYQPFGISPPDREERW